MKRVLAGILLLLALLGGIAASYAYVHVEHRHAGEYFDSGGARLHFTREGSGPPLILLHGFAINADLQWRRPGIIDALSKQFTVYTFDHRGHGLSEKRYQPQEYGVEMVEDVVRLMDHLGIDRAHVAGYSMGGYVTLKLLTLHPDRLLSASICAAGWDQAADRQALVDELGASLFAGEGFAPLVRLLEPDGHPSWLKLHGMNLLLSHLNDQKALAAVVRSLPDLAVEEQALRDNVVPVLTVIGDQDPLKPGADRLQGVLAQHTAVVIPGENHTTTMYAPAFRNALQEFLKQHSFT